MGHAERPAGGPAERDSIGRRALTLMRCAWTCYWMQRAARATIGIMHALDDRALDDMGLDRREIEPAVRGCPAGCACMC